MWPISAGPFCVAQISVVAASGRGTTRGVLWLRSSFVFRQGPLQILLESFRDCQRERDSKVFVEEERRYNIKGGNPSESLSEKNCPLEVLRGFFFLGNLTGNPPERSS